MIDDETAIRDGGEATAVTGLGAAAAAGDDDRLRAALDVAGPMFAPEVIDELLLQTYLFAGFPRTINAFFVWQGWAVRSGIQRDPRSIDEPDWSEWRRRGEELCRTIYDDHYEPLQKRLRRLHPAIAEWTLVEGYGKVLSRPGPGAARREMAAVGALIVLEAGRQLASHLLGALHVGVPRAALFEAARSVAAEWDRSAIVDEHLARL